MNTRKLSVFSLITALAASPTVAGELSDMAFSVAATNSLGTGEYEVSLDDMAWDPLTNTYVWSKLTPIYIYETSTGAWLASVNTASVTVRLGATADIALNCGVTGGATDTSFQIASPMVVVDAISSTVAAARATASFSLTDVGGNGARLSGVGPPGAGAFRMYYNGGADGTLFTQLIGYAEITGGTVNVSQYDPLWGYRAIPEEVTDLQVVLDFTVTSGDVAYATTSSGAPVPVACPGDIDNNRVRDLTDVTLGLSAYGACEVEGDGRYEPRADFDGSGCIELSDLAELLSFYSVACG